MAPPPFERERKASMNKKGLLNAAALLLMLGALAAYVATGRNEFNTALSMKVIVPLGVAAALEAVSLLQGVELLEYAAYLCGLYAWLQYLCSQVYYIVNVFVAIDGTTFSAGFLGTTAAGLLAWVLALAAARRLSRANDAAA